MKRLFAILGIAILVLAMTPAVRADSVVQADPGYHNAYRTPAKKIK